MTKLADKIEALEGPSREVDAEIWAYVHGPADCYIKQSPFNGAWCVYYTSRDGKERLCETRRGMPDKLAYTASLDAAMTLVPEGYDWFKLRRLDRLPHMIVEPAHREGNPRDYYHFGTARTPALALCAAALRAREANR